jgi:hypothetical protein
MQKPSLISPVSSTGQALYKRERLISLFRKEGPREFFLAEVMEYFKRE